MRLGTLPPKTRKKFYIAEFVAPGLPDMNYPSTWELAIEWIGGYYYMVIDFAGGG